MDQEKLLKYKEALLAKQKQITGEIERLNQVTDFGDDVDSMEEEADEYEEYGNQLSVAETLKNRLADINSSLAKIEANTFGACEHCGKNISEEVLDAAPESRLCEDCKKL